jgi:hypothetical protein
MNTFDLIPLDEKGSPVQKLWALVLLLAIKDRATRVWYDPALGDSRFGYEISGVEHTLVPPPEHLQALLVKAIRNLLRRRTVRGLIAWLLGGTVGQSASVEDFFLAKVGGYEVMVAATLNLPRSRVVLQLSPETGAVAAAHAALESYLNRDRPTKLRGFEEPGQAEYNAPPADRPRE